MPHLTIQYSKNLESVADIRLLCQELRLTMIDTGIFPLGGIRVRAFSAAEFSIADNNENNAFVDLVLRIGAGRTIVEKKAAGDALMQKSQHFFRTMLDTPYFALSLEVIEIDAELSWKSNSIHARLNQLT